MSSVAERQRTFRERRKAERAKGLERTVFMLTKEATTRIDALAGFYELEPEQVIVKAIEAMWKDRYDIQPSIVSEPRLPKVADDLAEPTRKVKKRTNRSGSLLGLDGRERDILPIESPKSRSAEMDQVEYPIHIHKRELKTP